MERSGRRSGRDRRSVERRGRSVALGTAALGLAVLAALAFAGREWIENRFWLWKLEPASGDAAARAEPQPQGASDFTKLSSSPSKSLPR